VCGGGGGGGVKEGEKCVREKGRESREKSGGREEQLDAYLTHLNIVSD
jgi:hypothetical protein